MADMNAWDPESPEPIFPQSYEPVPELPAETVPVDDAFVERLRRLASLI